MPDLEPTPAERRQPLPTLPAGSRPCARCSAAVEPGRSDCYCRPCRALYARERRERMKGEGDTAEARERRLERNLARRGAIFAAMGQSTCSRCGFEPQDGLEMLLLDFHHRNPADKSFEISPSGTRSLESLMEEAQKCDLLCANCHRLTHLEEGGPGIHRRARAGAPRRYADPEVG